MLKGYIFSEKSKRKMSETRLKRKAILGYLNSPETREKMRLSKIGKISPMKGKKNPNASKGPHLFKKGYTPWNKIGENGISSEREKIRRSVETIFWRKTIFIRDNFTCQKTGVKGGMLVAHHINNFSGFPELRFIIDNGITLSEKAHKEFHKIYGIKNNTREQLEEFLAF